MMVKYDFGFLNCFPGLRHLQWGWYLHTSHTAHSISYYCLWTRFFVRHYVGIATQGFLIIRLYLLFSKVSVFSQDSFRLASQSCLQRSDWASCPRSEHIRLCMCWIWLMPLFVLYLVSDISTTIIPMKHT